MVSVCIEMKHARVKKSYMKVLVKKKKIFIILESYSNTKLLILQTRNPPHISLNSKTHITNIYTSLSIFTAISNFTFTSAASFTSISSASFTSTAAFQLQPPSTSTHLHHPLHLILLYHSTFVTSSTSVVFISAVFTANLKSLRFYLYIRSLLSKYFTNLSNSIFHFTFTIL